jgi:hypothetical protein
MPLDQLLQNATSLFSLLPALVKLWQPSSLLQSPLAGSAGATMQLAAAAVQVMCSFQEQKQPEVATKLVSNAMHILLLSLQQMVSFATGVMYQASSDAVHNPAAACSRASASSSHTGQRNAQQQQQQQQEPQLVQQLILSTRWRNVSGFLLAAQCYAKLNSLQHPIPGATVGSSSSSSGSGSGGDIGSGGCSSSSSSVLYPDRVLTYTRSVSLASDWQHGLPAHTSSC